MISIVPLIHKRFSCILCCSTLILVILNGVVHSAETATVNAAKKETEIILYTVMSADNDRVMAEAFQKKYPGITVKSWWGSTETMLSRVLTEARSGDVQADEVKALLEALPGVEHVLDAQSKPAFGLDHPRSGELVALSRADSWFT